VLSLASACVSGREFGNSPAQTTSSDGTLSSTASSGVVQTSNAVPSGPEGWWLVAQRLPRTDFGPGFAYFLVPADIQANTPLQTSERFVAFPSVCLCSGARGVRLVRLAPRGGQVAVFCWLENDGFWVWNLNRSRTYHVTVESRIAGEREAQYLLLENPLWSFDGQTMFMKTTGGYLVSVHIQQGKVETHRQMNGIPLALDPQNRYLAERVYDESVRALDGSSKQYEISHLYFLDLITGDEEKWEIPKIVRRFLPLKEQCWVSDYEHSVGWEPQSGNQFLFMVECGSKLEDNGIKQYVFLVDRTLNHAQILWRSSKPVHITAIWEPHGQGILLQISYVDANGVFQDGQMVFMDEQGHVISTWQGFPTSTLSIIGWGIP